MEHQTYPRRVGDDRIKRRGEQLVVCSKVDMDEWQIQQYRKTAIYINDEVWCLVGKQYMAAKEVRYLLDPWPELLKEIPGRRIRYDEEYVKARTEAERKRKIEAGVGPVLHHFKALIGFLPSRVKSRIQASFGVPARNATFISIIIELFLFFVLGAFLQIFTFGAMRQPGLAVYIPVFIVLVPVLFVDLVMRYNSYIREDASPLGVFEWVVRRKRRNLEDSKTRRLQP
jgi:hypothetical protein